jgi:hypothetical protein
VENNMKMMIKELRNFINDNNIDSFSELIRNQGTFDFIWNAVSEVGQRILDAPLLIDTSSLIDSGGFMIAAAVAAGGLIAFSFSLISTILSPSPVATNDPADSLTPAERLDMEISSTL